MPSTVEFRMRFRNSLVRRSSRSSSRARVTSRKAKIAASCSDRMPIDATETVMQIARGRDELQVEVVDGLAARSRGRSAVSSVAPERLGDDLRQRPARRGRRARSR